MGLLLAASAAGCGSWRLVGDDPGPDPGELVPLLFDAPAVYRGMGLLVAPDPIPFVATLRYLAGADGDSTIVAVGASFSNSALMFRRNGLALEARYRAEITFLREGVLVGQVGQDHVVQVATLAETHRTDESVIFQQFMSVPPGAATVSVVVRDPGRGTFSRVEGSADVPAFGSAQALSSLVPVYRAELRAMKADRPDFVLNPRATIPYGVGSLQVYLEGYQWPDAAPVVVRVLSEEEEIPDAEVWRDTVRLVQGDEVAAAIVAVPKEALPVGRIRIEGAAIGGVDTARSAALVAFSDQWVVANFEEVLVLLRYFATAAALERLRAASPEERPYLWREFWEASDPDPRTEEHEALDAYFQRLQAANEQFREGSDPGWATDRGEVFITLGEPDEIYDSSSDLQGRGGRWIRWTYISHRLILTFGDESGFGRFRLDGASRSAFELARERLRFGQ